VSGSLLWTDEGLVPFLKDSPFGIPCDFGDAMRWPGLTRAGRLRALRDLVSRKKNDDVEETLGAFLRRRLGDEATDVALGPLLGGLFAGDVDRLSARATFPELVAWERLQGSLIRGSQAARRVAAREAVGPMFVRPRGGVACLPEALARVLDTSVECGEPVGALPNAPLVVIATPAFEAARLLRDIAPDAAEGLDGIRYVSTSVVALVYPEETGSRLPEATGVVVPRGKAAFTACTFLSKKWPEASFGSRAVIRCYVGADGEEEILEAADADLIDACARHLSAVLDLPARVGHGAVHRWQRSMPQYEPGHQERVAQIREALPPGILLVGNAYDGVGVADTIRAANETAERAAGFLRVGEAVT
jgi:oxygen-dependent protoporphyrinogen oxidase